MTPLQTAIVAILDNAAKLDWSVQGFGMLRLYVRDFGRIHIWDSALRYPGVSMIHNHSWDLSSTVVIGAVHNTRYTIVDPECPDAKPYAGKRMITGYHCSTVEEFAVPTFLVQRPAEHYRAGMVYAQFAHEIHRTDAVDGTVTLMSRKEDENGQADIFWPVGEQWGTAKPRKATDSEIVAARLKALALCGL